MTINRKRDTLFFGCEASDRTKFLQKAAQFHHFISSDVVILPQWIYNFLSKNALYLFVLWQIVSRRRTEEQTIKNTKTTSSKQSCHHAVLKNFNSCVCNEPCKCEHAEQSCIQVAGIVMTLDTTELARQLAPITKLANGRHFTHHGWAFRSSMFCNFNELNSHVIVYFS